jgi:hypothetical protein
MAPEQNLMFFVFLLFLIGRAEAPLSEQFARLSMSMWSLHKLQGGLCSQERNARGDLLRVKHGQSFEPWSPGFGVPESEQPDGSTWLTKIQPNCLVITCNYPIWFPVYGCNQHFSLWDWRPKLFSPVRKSSLVSHNISRLLQAKVCVDKSAAFAFSNSTAKSCSSWSWASYKMRFWWKRLG